MKNKPQDLVNDVKIGRKGRVRLPIIPTIFTICALVVLVGMASWQVKRLLWKDALIKEINAKLEILPVKLNDLSFAKDEASFEQMQYRKFRIKGKFLHESEMHLFTGAREMKGDLGYDILTPFILDNGEVVLVDRGWVPSDMKDQMSRPKTLHEGEAELVVMLHKGEVRPSAFTPNNDLLKNIWFWIDMPLINEVLKLKLGNYYFREVAVGYVGKDILPAPGKVNIELRNDHLEYAITWSLLAVILLVIYVLYVRQFNIKEIRE